MKIKISAFGLLMLCVVGCGEPVEDKPNPILITQSCGDGTCAASESASTCPQDCDAPPTAQCGDGTCAASESASTCPRDCGEDAFCGNLFCEMGEDAMSCPGDCAQGASCGDQFCDMGEDVTTCPQDCEPICGDQVCDFFEDAQSCPQDCASEAVCGDGVCEDPETPVTCGQDCGAPELCGNGTCDPVESEGTCPQDCPRTPRCGDDVCEAGETEATCPQDCTPVCMKKCTGKVCGPDGCGGMCGSCSGRDTCDASGQCQPPAPVPESYAYDVQHSASGPMAGALVSVTSTPGAITECTYDTATNWLSVTLRHSNGTHELRMYVESDPIGFCLFNTSAFNTFDYVLSPSGGGFTSWGVDTPATRNLALACQLRDNKMRLTGEFSSGRLFKGKSSSAFPGDHVTIQNGTFSCDL